MPTIAARCPKCKSVFRLKDASLAGKKIKCRKCQTPFVVQPIKSGGGAGRVASSSVDPYGRDISFSKSGELPVSGRKIKKIQKVVETAEPEADEPEEFGRPAAPTRRRKLRGKKGKTKGAANSPKKKKKKKPGSTQQQKMIAIGGGVVLLALIVVGAVFGPTMAKRITSAGKIDPPEKYLVYEPADSQLTIEYPDGWEASHGGGHSNRLYFLRVKHAGLEIFIVEYDPQKAAMNAALTGGGSRFDSTDKDPSYAVHLRRLKEIQETNSGFEENPPKEILTGLGIAQYSVFTDPGIFGSTTGFRVTLAGGAFTGYFRCSPKQFDTAKPIFKHMIESIGTPEDDA